VQLSAGTTYRLAAYTGGGTYYWRDDLGSAFQDGTLSTSYEGSGDAFPTIADSARWWFVGLRYTVGSTISVPVTPSISGSFVQGVWTGLVTVPQTLSNLVLRADNGFLPAADANAIQVVDAPGLETERYGDILLFLWPLWPAGSPAFQLETSTNLAPSSWVPIAQPPLQIEGLNVVPASTSDPHRFFRLNPSAP